MNLNNMNRPKSSFLAQEKDMNIIVRRIMGNNNLKKLLYYTSANCLEKPNLTPEQSASLFGNQIKIVPKIEVDSEVMNYLLINFDSFLPSSNPEFRDNVIEFDIICHYSQWQLGDFQLRPYRIAAELDSMIDKGKLTGIGDIEFLSATQLINSSEFGGLCLKYLTYHGGEDKYHQTTPKNEELFMKNFEEMKKNGIV